MRFRFIIFVAAALLVSKARAADPSEKNQTVLFFGDSITAGFGVEPDKAYPALIQKKIDFLGWPFRVVNVGVSGDTTSAGVERLRWTLRQKVDVLVLALGGNDGLRGVPPATAQENLQRMIDLAKKTDPKIQIILAGMKMPPNYGEKYTARFAAIYPELAKTNQVPLIPFLLEGVGGVSKLNLPDRIHPTAEGQAIVAETVWTSLKPLLERRLRQ